MFGVVPRMDGQLSRKLSGPPAFVGFGLTMRRSRITTRADRWRADRSIFEDAKRSRCFYLLAERLLAIGLSASDQPRTAAAILASVARHHGFTVAELKSARRVKKVVLARQEAAYRIISETPLSYPQVGKLLHRDHTTILHAVAKHAERTGAPQIHGQPRRRRAA